MNWKRKYLAMRLRQSRQRQRRPASPRSFRDAANYSGDGAFREEIVRLLNLSIGFETPNRPLTGDKSRRKLRTSWPGLWSNTLEVCLGGRHGRPKPGHDE